MKSNGSRRWRYLIATALVISACGGDDDDDDAADDPPTSAASTGTTGGTGGEAAAQGGKVVFGASFEPLNLDAHLAENAGNYIATWSVNEPLVDLDVSGELQPVLATELPVRSEDDPTKWRVTLREGVTFSNGEPFNAEAVRFNVERIQDPAFVSLVELSTLRSAEVVDEYTVDLITDGPDPILDIRLPHFRMVPPEAAAAEAYGQEEAIGTGPFVVDRWDRGQRIILTPNPDYWGEPGTLDEVELRFIPDLSTRVSALQAGEIDIADSMPIDQVGTVPTYIESAAPVEAGANRFNLYTFPYSDPNFRRALNYAVDKEALNDSLFGGLYSVNHCQPVVEQAGGFNTALEAYPYDPEKAAELLAQVDLPDDFVLQWEGSVGVYERDRELSLAMASYWEAIGLKVDTEINEVNAYLDKIFNPDSGLILAQTNQSMYDSSRQAAFYMDREGDVSALGPDAYPELDALVDTALTTLDDEERQESYDEIWRIACDDAFFVYTLDFFDVWGASERVQYDPGIGELFRVDFSRMSVTD
jgi:peptide/nickel transport system substrate-binding protein